MPDNANRHSEVEVKKFSKKAAHGSPMGSLGCNKSLKNVVSANGGPAGSVSQRGSKASRKGKNGLPNYGGSSKFNRNVG